MEDDIKVTESVYLAQNALYMALMHKFYLYIWNIFMAKRRNALQTPGLHHLTPELTVTLKLIVSCLTVSTGQDRIKCIDY